ncbi:unnamed protein product [Macrosiphum euphorbiae]|uniref:RNA-directed DNA polymerase n=1 Tax=Macrosiphum euphorbiae TaxID=13131 RepID=A0AAV0XSU2_9HEMI|nr:unnamed protein product [Macrosiphum euphorbiae]
MEKLLRPDRFETDPNSPTSAKEWAHWITKFNNFVEVAKVKEEDKLKVLTNFLGHSVYDSVSECTTYGAAIKILTDIYIKQKNEIFARHLLATRKQQMNESIDQYLGFLKILSKECAFKSVSAIEYRDEYIRDSFINGRLSNNIRQRLLENNTLKLEEAVTRSRALEMAQKQSEVYSMPLTQGSVNALTEYTTSMIKPDNNQPTVSAIQQKCYFCGYDKHPRSSCPARDAVCKKCDKKGHFLKVCRSKTKSDSAFVSMATLACVTATVPGLLSKAIIRVKVNNIDANTLIDTGSSNSFINEEFVQIHKIKSYPENGQVLLATTTYSSNLKGYVLVDLLLQEHTYKNLKLSILPKLCSDILIGHDVLRTHSSIDLTFGGPKPPLSICNMTFVNIEPPRLFNNVVKDCKPVAVKSRRYSDEDAKFIREEVTKLLYDNIIEESTSPWRAQVLITKSENHKRRMVIDYSQTINKFTLMDAFPLPNIDELVSKVAQHTIYSTIDLRSAYYQIPIHEDERQYTAFEAGGRLYQFRKIPFGVTNGVACFQRVIDTIISQENLDGVYAYLDDITICGNNQTEHDLNLNKFLTIIKKYGLILNEDKCQFSKCEISLLGHHISNKRISPDPERLKPLLNLPQPKDASSLKRVLGMFSHYSKWIQGFSDKIRSLVDCKSFPMSPIAAADFERIKQDIAKSVVNSINSEELLVVESDASDFALAATLSQSGRPVAFFSRSLTEGEKRHPSVEKEAYAIVEAVRKWRHFLIGRHFKLITDQEAVSFMFNLKHSSKIKSDKITRWRLELSSFSYDIVYRPGKENRVADAFSRVCANINNPSKLFDLHKALCHPGMTRMYHWTRSKNLPFTLDDIKRVTTTCPICAEVKPKFFKQEGNHLIKATLPFERLNIDFKGPLPSNTSNHYILTIVDEYSRFPFAVPCRDISSTTVINSLWQLFSIFGMPAYIHSDRGSSFMSQELTTFLHNHGIATSRTTPYNPEGNGQAERYNGIIWKAIQLAQQTQRLKITQWEEVLTDALHSIRSLLCTAINCTPHERFFHYPRRSSNGKTLPSWLNCPGPVLIRKHVKSSKYDPLVEEAELIEANPEYALVRYNNGRESTVSLKDLAPPGDRGLLGEKRDREHSIKPSSVEAPAYDCGQENKDIVIEEPTQMNEGLSKTLSDVEEPRRSTRTKNKPKYLEDYKTN